MRRVDRIGPLIGKELGSVVEEVLVDAGEIPRDAIVGASPGWIFIRRCVVVDGQARVEFVIDLASVTIRGCDTGSRRGR